MMCRAINLLVLLLLPLALWSQIDPSYIRHLSQHRLKTEHQVYLNRQEGLVAPDTLRYYQLKYALQYREHDLFANQFPYSNQLFLQDSTAMMLTALWYLEDDRRPTFDQMRWLQTSPFPTVKKLALAFEATEKTDVNIDLVQLPGALHETWLNYSGYARKKPWKAAALSAILPGSGKWYAGRPRSAVSNTIGVGLFAMQAIESYRKLGHKHPLTIGNFLVLGIFYGGNIVGSAKAVTVRRTELRNIFYKDAALYYRRLHRPVLY